MDQLLALKAAGVSVVVVEPDGAMIDRMPKHIHIVSLSERGFVQEPL